MIKVLVYGDRAHEIAPTVRGVNFSMYDDDEHRYHSSIYYPVAPALGLIHDDPQELERRGLAHLGTPSHLASAVRLARSIGFPVDALLIETITKLYATRYDSYDSPRAKPAATNDVSMILDAMFEQKLDLCAIALEATMGEEEREVSFPALPFESVWKFDAVVYMSSRTTTIHAQNPQDFNYYPEALQRAGDNAIAIQNCDATWPALLTALDNLSIIRYWRRELS
jgi:hypothetical protein